MDVNGFFAKSARTFFCPARGICGMMDAEKGDDRMKIVILDGYTENPGDLSWDALRAFGSVTVYDRTPDDDAVIAGRSGEAKVIPCSISSTEGWNNYQPTPAQGEEKERIMNRINELCEPYKTSF